MLVIKTKATRCGLRDGDCEMGTARWHHHSGSPFFKSNFQQKPKAIYEVLLRSLKIGYVETYAALKPDTGF